RIRELANNYEEYKNHLLCLHDNIKDLMEIFEKRHYYIKEMKGSYSIKYVLPALCPNDEALNYKKLNIQNGSQAMDVFAKLHLKEETEKEAIRKDLLKYCELDTLAMVKIWEKLNYLINLELVCN
ncbi:DUF2779 domain-containing protein, partial [Romboutsia sp.]|uniref:DUF2779 domain-containing protein n=1 Tax=Romboutsia sp. TaxID=1965302 RepID=UPI003F3C5154